MPDPIQLVSLDFLHGSVFKLWERKPRTRSPRYPCSCTWTVVVFVSLVRLFPVLNSCEVAPFANVRFSPKL